MDEFKIDQKHLDILNSLDVVLDDLTDEQKNKLNRAAQRVRNPNRITPSEAMAFVKDLGIDIEAIQKKARQARAEAGRAKKKPKIGRNQKCPCGSGKKYKKCCIFKESKD